MISAPTVNIKGTDAEKTVLPKDVFEKKVKPVILAQAVRVWLSNQRAANAKTKTRTEVSKTTAKMYKQKGTGRARHGSYSAPIFVGGGVAHGPTGTQNYKLRMPEKMKKLAMAGALSVKAAEKKILILAGADKASGKTKEAEKIFKKLDFQGKRVLVVATNKQTSLIRAVKNLERVNVISAPSLNTYFVLGAKQLVITVEAVEELSKRISKEVKNAD